MKVVCINDNWQHKASDGSLRPRFPDLIYPVKGQVYTIRQILTFENAPFYLFDEIKNPEMIWILGVHEMCFATYFFRPVTDISELQKLTKIKTHELEEV